LAAHLENESTEKILIMEKQRTLDTTLEQFLKAKPVLDSRQYMAQAHILLDGNDRQDI
jgi:hypothetical protein